jgi:acyl-CoA thioester hydrolase
MKHDAWRHDAAQYTATYDIPARYADVDTLRHLNNSALHGLHQEARMRFLAERIGDGFWRERGPRLLARRVTTDFLLESQYPQVLQAAVRVTALDDAQLVLASALFQHGRCVGLQTTSCAPVRGASRSRCRRPGSRRWTAPCRPRRVTAAGPRRCCRSGASSRSSASWTRVMPTSTPPAAPARPR